MSRYNKPTSEQLEQMNRYRMKSAEKARKEITVEEQERIKALYEKCAEDVERKIKEIGISDTVSDSLKKQQLEQLLKEVKDNAREISYEIDSGLRKAMLTTASATTEAAREMLSKMGFVNVNQAFIHVPREVVENIATGKIYDKKWFLSDRIWGIEKETLKDINYIIAEGMKQGKGSLAIAKDIEMYVRPSAKKPWDWKKVYPSSSAVVDYNAQRLARTLTSHAYQQSFISVTEGNPFVTSYRWLANGSRACPLCQDLDGAIFEKGSVPLDHPQGMCELEVVLDKWEDINSKIADWYLSDDGKYPDLDKYARSLGYDAGK